MIPPDLPEESQIGFGFFSGLTMTRMTMTWTMTGMAFFESSQQQNNNKTMTRAIGYCQNCQEMRELVGIYARQVETMKQILGERKHERKRKHDAITLVGYDGDGVRVGLNHLRHLVVLFL